MTIRTEGPSKSAKRTWGATQVRLIRKEVIRTRKQRKDTPKRTRKPVKWADVAVLVTALGTLFTSLAALLNALK